MQENTLASVIEPILAEHGLELDSMEVTPLGKRSVLRISVDGDGPLGRGPLLDDIARAASSISAALDESDAVGERPYTLEVSSRGVSTPLTAAKHYRRNTGRLVKLWLAEGDTTGRIVEATEEGVTLDVEGTHRTVALSDIRKAVVQVELNRSLADDDGEEA
ncbi:MAG TPA: ribosome maturation factor RimP [Arachnia sp.]|nr:ribosome maturation factor RimP [Arachnia sp.]